MTQTEALKLALEALEQVNVVDDDCDILAPSLADAVVEAITAIKAALANEALERKAENARELGLDYYVPCCTDKTCSKCKAALEAKDEPVAWYRNEDGIRIYYETKAWDDCIPLYTTPPPVAEPHKRKPMTNDEIVDDYYKFKADKETSSEPVAHSVIAGALFDFMGWLTSREKRLILSSVDEASPAVEAITEFAKKRNLSLKYAEVGYWMEFLSTPPQQEAKDEPVGEVLNERGEVDYISYVPPVGTALYTTPPKQEAKDEPVPVAIVEVFGKDWRLDYMALPVGKHKLYAQQYTYTTPPQRTWQNLTDEEIEELDMETSGTVHDFVRAIEAKLKEKNYG